MILTQTNLKFVQLFILIIINIINSSEHICNEPEECDEGTILCRENEDCTVICENDFACRKATVLCPEYFQCSVTCRGDYTSACQYINISAIHSTELSVNIIPGDLRSSHGDTTIGTMHGGHIYCPDNGIGPFLGPDDDASFDVLGNPIKTHDVTKIVCSIECDGDDVMRDVSIYAVEGFNDVIIKATQYGSAWCYRSGNMFCRSDYIADCHMTATDPFQCNTLSADHTCTTAISPTRSPTDSPSNTPTSQPILSPTISPTIAPSEHTDGRAPESSESNQPIQTEEEFIEVPTNNGYTALEIALITTVAILAFLITVGLIVWFMQWNKSKKELQYEKTKNTDEENGDGDGDGDGGGDAGKQEQSSIPDTHVQLIEDK